MSYYWKTNIDDNVLLEKSYIIEEKITHHVCGKCGVMYGNPTLHGIFWYEYSIDYKFSMY